MKEAMVERLVEAVKGIAGEGYEVKSTVVKKNNGVELDAVNIRKAGENVVPTTRLQSMKQQSTYWEYTKRTKAESR